MVQEHRVRGQGSVREGALLSLRSVSTRDSPGHPTPQGIGPPLTAGRRQSPWEVSPSTTHRHPQA